MRPAESGALGAELIGFLLKRLLKYHIFANDKENAVSKVKKNDESSAILKAGILITGRDVANRAARWAVSWMVDFSDCMQGKRGRP